MDILKVINTLDLLELEYTIEQVANNLKCLTVHINMNNKKIYYNSKTYDIIENFEQKAELKKQIKELQKKLRNLC